jgi:hypothetical protein
MRRTGYNSGITFKSDVAKVIVGLHNMTAEDRGTSLLRNAVILKGSR